MKPATLGKNIEEVFSRVLVTRDEIEKLKNDIQGVASENIETIDQVLSEITDTQALIEAEYSKVTKEWKKMIVEYNSFMDGTEWEKSILPELQKYFIKKLDLFLQQFLTLLKICEDFFEELLDKKWNESYSKFDLDKNPYYSGREDISEKSKKVRMNFTLPDSLGYNWYSAKISDEYLEVKKCLLMIHKFGDKPNGSKLDSYLKGKTITETLMFHPRYGLLNYVGTGRNRDHSGLVDNETRTPFLQVQVKNMDSFQGQYNEMKNYHFANDLHYNGDKVDYESNCIEPEYFAIMRHIIDPEYLSLDGDSYFIFKIRDNSPLYGLTPKHYQISRLVTDNDQLEEEFSYTIKDNGEIIEKKILSLDLNTKYPTKKGPNNNSLSNYFGSQLDKIKEHRLDNNVNLTDYFNIYNNDFVSLNNNSEYLNFSNDEVNRVLRYMYITEEANYAISSILLSNSEKDFKNNIIFYKRKGFGKFRKDYDLFKNWVLKILPPDYTPFTDTIRNVLDKKYPISGKHLGIIMAENPNQLFRDNVLDSLIVKPLRSYYNSNDVDMKIPYDDYLNYIIRKIGRNSSISHRLMRYNFNEYFDLFDNPNRFNNYFFTPFSNVDKNAAEEDQPYFKGLKGNYETVYSENISKKSNIFPKVVSVNKKPEWNNTFSNRYSDDHIDDNNGLSWFVSAASADKATTHVIISCIKYTENTRNLYTLEYKLTSEETDFYRSCFITGNKEFGCISFKDRKATIFKFNEEKKAIEFSKRITLPITLLTAKDTSNSKTNWTACCYTNDIVYNSYNNKLYGLGTNEEGTICLYKINPETFSIEEDIIIPQNKGDIYIESEVADECSRLGTANSVDKQIEQFKNKEVILHLQHNPYNGAIFMSIAETPKGICTLTFYNEQPNCSCIMFDVKTKRFDLIYLGPIHTHSTYTTDATRSKDITKFFFTKNTDYFAHYEFAYNGSESTNNHVKYLYIQNIQSNSYREISTGKLVESNRIGTNVDCLNNTVFFTKDGVLGFTFDIFELQSGTNNIISPLYCIKMESGSELNNNEHLAVSNSDLTLLSTEGKNYCNGIYSRKYNKVYMSGGTFGLLDEGLVSSDSIKINHSSRSLLNHTAISETDESEIFTEFYKEIDRALESYSSLTIGTIKAIPYDPDNPDFLDKYAKAGTILSKDQYPEAYALLGDIYADQYVEDIEEGYFALPNLVDRYLENTNSSDKVNKIYEDQFADLGYTLMFEENNPSIDDDLREGFISEMKESTTSLSLATGTQGGTDRKKIRVGHNSTASVTSGADFRLDYYIKVK